MKEVETYIDGKEHWKAELNLLRKILLSANMKETIKWGAPVYSDKGKNIVGLSAFKKHVGLWFFQGATLKDTQKVLLNAQEGKTAAMRQWRFFSLKEIDADLIIEYIQEAIENQEKGNVIKPKRNLKPLIIDDLLEKAFSENNLLLKKFESFSLSKKREYADYISEAKRDATKLKRLTKITPMILDGKGLHDKYKSC